MSSQKKLPMKMCQKGHKTQKKCVKSSQIWLKEVVFTVLRSKARILRRLCKILRRHASVCLPLLETLGTLKCFVPPQTIKYTLHVPHKRHFMFIMWLDLRLRIFLLKIYYYTFFVDKFKIAHSEAHFVNNNKIQHKALPQVMTPW